jgi:polyisoprenoid-binding protein YceI
LGSRREVALTAARRNDQEPHYCKQTDSAVPFPTNGRTDKSGLFSAAGHQHAILAMEWSVDPSINTSDLTNSSVTITIPISSLVIDSAEARHLASLGPGPKAEDIRKIQDRMLGPEVPDTEKYRSIQFKTTSVEKTGAAELRLTGQLVIHGQTHQVIVPVRYTRGNRGDFEFSGQFAIRQTDYEIQPESAGLGTVNVKNEVQIRFHISMVPADS